MQRGRIDGAYPAHHEGLDFRDMGGKQHRGEHRRDGKGGEQRARERKTVGSRHRIEDLAFDALHSEQRYESRHRDRGGEEDGFVDFKRAAKIRRDRSVHVAAVVASAARVGSEPHRSSARRSSSICRASRLPWQLRNMFSTRITAESTMMPKSTAPTDN